MNIREQILQECIEIELFNTYSIVDNKKVPTYVLAGYDKEKIECEGSTWIVYVYDCMGDYYRKNKEYFDNWVNDCLKSALV